MQSVKHYQQLIAKILVLIAYSRPQGYTAPAFGSVLACCCILLHYSLFCLFLGLN